MIRDILKLGNPQLYEISTNVTDEDFSQLGIWARDLHDTLLDYREKYGAGRAIAAPQIGIRKRLLYMLTDKEYVIINPVISYPDDELMEVLDDCMSFPGLCVKVMRHRRIVLDFTDVNGVHQKIEAEGDIAELLQHEYDHLDGILATMRAIDNKSFVLQYMKR